MVSCLSLSRKSSYLQFTMALTLDLENILLIANFLIPNMAIGLGFMFVPVPQVEISEIFKFDTYIISISPGPSHLVEITSFDIQCSQT